MIRDEIRKDIAGAVGKIGNLTIQDIEVNRTADNNNGDYSSNIALKLASSHLQNPLEIAKKISDNISKKHYIEKVEVAGPGFLNFFISADYWQKEVQIVLKQVEKYGSNSNGKGKKARVEFISANPTGPMHFGNARGGPIGDVLASVLSFSGYKVIREYIHNDIGGQVEKLGESILNVKNGKKLEEQEYKGEYVSDLANKIKDASDAKEIGKKAVDLMLSEAIEDAREIGIVFDNVYPESKFVEDGSTKQAINDLQEKGVLKKKDGAIWFAPNDEFLKDRETVVVKSDGSYTYFANDIAYHNLKFKDADLVIDIFGANHHGHVPRLKAVISALGYDVSNFHVILYQWVRFKKSGNVVAMSKRSGIFVTAREILLEVGRDALRFFILMHDPNSHIDFDLDLAREKSKKNPVYYVQYAYARISSILDKSESQNDKSEAEYRLLSSVYEINLIKQISRLPELVEDVAASFAVHQLTTYALDLADSFHKFYENCPVISEKDELKKARLQLLFATRIALKNTLDLLGVSAPEKM